MAIMQMQSYKMCALVLMTVGVADGASFLKVRHARNASIPGCGDVVPAMREIHAQAIEKGKLLSKNHETSVKLEETVKIAKDEQADLKADAKKAGESGSPDASALAKKIGETLKKAKEVEAKAKKNIADVKEVTAKITAVKAGEDVPKKVELQATKEAAEATKDKTAAKAVAVKEAKIGKDLTQAGIYNYIGRGYCTVPIYIHMDAYFPKPATSPDECAARAHADKRCGTRFSYGYGSGDPNWRCLCDQIDKGKVCANPKVNGEWHYYEFPKVFPTYTWNGGALSAPKNKVVQLDSKLWPSDYCLDFDVTVPSQKNSNAYGYEGTIAMLGQVDLVVTHTKKLLKGGCMGKFGFMVIEQSNGGGPYFATKGLVKPGERQKGTFCYKESTSTPSFTINGKAEGGYLHNPSAKYPSTRTNTYLSFLTGSHTSTTVEALKGGAQLHAFSIRKA